jgi:hypothetical protein
LSIKPLKIARLFLTFPRIIRVKANLCKCLEKPEETPCNKVTGAIPGIGKLK